MTNVFHGDDLTPEQALSGARTALFAMEAEEEESDRRRDAEFLARTGETYQEWKSRSYRNAIAYGPSEEDLEDENVDIW
jgi:hypothetical protein